LVTNEITVATVIVDFEVYNSNFTDFDNPIDDYFGVCNWIFYDYYAAIDWNFTVVSVLRCDTS